jgi:hypothetical protein
MMILNVRGFITRVFSMGGNMCVVHLRLEERPFCNDLTYLQKLLHFTGIFDRRIPLPLTRDHNRLEQICLVGKF